MQFEFEGRFFRFWFSYRDIRVDKQGKEMLHCEFPKPKHADYAMAVAFGKHVEYDEVGYRAANRAWHQVHRELTSCQIEMGAPGEPRDATRQAWGCSVIRWYKDPPNRLVAREAALRTALGVMGASEELALEFWRCHFSECRASKQAKELADTVRV